MTHKDLLATAAAAGKTLSLTSADIVLTTAPVWTYSGLACTFLAAAAQGPAKVVLAGKTFDAAGALKAAELHQPTVVVTTPEHAAALSAEAAKDAAKPADKQTYAGALSKLRGGLVVTHGGAPAQAVTLGAAKLAPVDAVKAL